MSDLRDARLHKALESAPDADARPDARVRRNILAKAHEAVAPKNVAPGWQRLWQSSGSARAPWNAAFATIAVATLVTVLWHDREVPDAQSQAVPAALMWAMNSSVTCDNETSVMSSLCREIRCSNRSNGPSKLAR